MTKYVITRSSCWDEQPHKDAKLGTVNSCEYRSCTVACLRDVHAEKDWNEYENCAVGCRKPTKVDVWTIEIEDIEKFADKNGKIIVFNNRELYPHREIEIYDDWRE